MTLPMWHNLMCECGGEEFLSLVHLRCHPTGGTSREQGGLQCAKCGKNVDMGALIQRDRLKQKKEELRALTEEIGSSGKNM